MAMIRGDNIMIRGDKISAASAQRGPHERCGFGPLRHSHRRAHFT